MHHLYDPRRSELKELDRWLRAEARRRDERREVARVSQEELERAYALMLWCDTLSLTLCEEALPFGEREMEVEALPSGQISRALGLGLAQRDVMLWPWPFGPDCLELAVHAESHPDRAADVCRPR